MTNYRLSGIVFDSEGVKAVVKEFTCSAQRHSGTIEFYLRNGFRGSLLQVRTELNGTKTHETINLENTGYTPNTINA